MIDFSDFAGGGLDVSTGLTGSTLIDFDRALLRVSGFAVIQISEFVHISGNFAFTQGGTISNAKLSDGSTYADPLSLMLTNET